MRGGMGNMQNMMRQVQKMQKEMQKTQAELNEQEFTGKSANDLVEATFSGEKVLKDLKINAEVIDPEDPDMLQDLVIDAVNNALAEVTKETEAKMGKYTKGLM